MSEELYTPDILAKFTLLRDKLEELSNIAEEELGTNHNITFQTELLLMWAIDLADDVELVVAMNEN